MAGEIVRVDFTYTNRDFLLGAWEYHFTRGWPLATGAFCLLAGLLGIALVPDLTWLYVLVMVLGVIVASGVAPVLATLVLILRDRTERKPAHLEMGPAGMAYAEPNASSNVGWQYFKKARLTRHFLAIAYPTRNTSLVPLRIFTPDQLTRIKTWIAPLLARS